MQGLFEAGADFIIADEQQVVVLLQEIHSPSSPESIHIPNTRVTGKRVKIASALAVFGYFKIRKCLGLRQKDDIDTAIIRLEISFAGDRAAGKPAVGHLENTAQLRGEHALDGETMTFQSVSQLRRIGIDRIARRKQGRPRRTLGRLREYAALWRSKKQDKAGQEMDAAKVQVRLAPSPRMMATA
jgi:hypothetical protein